MLPFRIIKSGVLLAGLVATLGQPLRAAGGGFTATLSNEEMTAAGIATLSADEVTALDRLVVEDLDRMRLLNSDPLTSTFADRQTSAERQEAGLDRLTPEQLARLNYLVATSTAFRPSPLQPRERPRLKDNEAVSLKRRLEVHGGMSLTYGWAGGGRNYREAAAWVSYYDPVTGIGIGFSYSRSKGDGFYGYYPDYYGTGGYYYGASATATSRTYFPTADRLSVSADAGRGGFNGDGASLRGSSVKGRPGVDFRR